MLPNSDDGNEIEEFFAGVDSLFQAKEYHAAAALLLPFLEGFPDHPRVLNALGTVACELGDFSLASRHIERALAIDPAYVSALNCMGNILLAQGKAAEARGAFLRAVVLDPELACAHYNLGLIDLNNGDLEGADRQLGRAASLDPGHYHTCFYQGVSKLKRHELAEALVFFLRARSLDPARPNAWTGCVQILQDQNKSVAAEELCREGLVATGNHVQLLLMLGVTLLSQGRVAEAQEAYRAALARDPEALDPYCNLMYAMNYDPLAQQEEIYRLGRAWEAASFARTPRMTHTPRAGEAERVLRIGYVSGDLRGHPVGSHLLPVLRNHDRSRFSIHCYFNSFVGDSLTREFVELSDGWQVIAHLTDEEVAQLIQKDGIDILVDLSGHTALNRLPLFARKPAPVQVSWLGYFNTTGLSAIDYLFTDDVTVLPGEEQWFAEQVYRLPWSRFCVSPYASLPDVVPPPSLAKGYVTFGSFNMLAKINPQLVTLWASIMRELPGSRLILKRGALSDETLKQRFRDLFAAQGIAPERLELREGSSYQEMLVQYGDVDISLDTFPFSGGMTTLDSLAMGVPVVTLSGKLPVSRQTRSFLRALNLLELVATKEERYRCLVVDLARDPDRLAQLRRELRGRLLESYLCDGKGFTGNLEVAYRSIWRTWCKSAPAPRKRKVT